MSKLDGMIIFLLPVTSVMPIMMCRMANNFLSKCAHPQVCSPRTECSPRVSGINMPPCSLALPSFYLTIPSRLSSQSF
eukprot:361643-Pelagomonas_calceolata.AAC.1